jgi:hypothetical protein
VRVRETAARPPESRSSAFSDGLATLRSSRCCHAARSRIRVISTVLNFPHYLCPALSDRAQASDLRAARLGQRKAICIMTPPPAAARSWLRSADPTVTSAGDERECKQSANRPHIPPRHSGPVDGGMNRRICWRHWSEHYQEVPLECCCSTLTDQERRCGPAGDFDERDPDPTLLLHAHNARVGERTEWTTAARPFRASRQRSSGRLQPRVQGAVPRSLRVGPRARIPRARTNVRLRTRARAACGQSLRSTCGP